MLVIGLCGGIGSGKNTAQRFFADFGIPGLDADEVYHRLTDAPSGCTRALAKAFGDTILRSDGSLDRRALAALVFGDGGEFRQRRELLNRLTHGAVLEECRAFLKKAKENGAFAALINAPLLFESGFDAECDLTVALLASQETRIARIMARDGLTHRQAEERIAAQPDDTYLRTHTDCRIENDGTPEELREKIRAFCLGLVKEGEQYVHRKKQK